MTAYLRTGDYPEALVKILLTIMEKTPGGGATLEDLKEAYRETRDRYPSDRTIYRAIRRLNLLFDPLAYGEDPDTGPDEDPAEPDGEGGYEQIPPVIQPRRIKGKTRYSYTGEFPAASVDANQALMMTLSLYTQQKGLLKDHFEAVIKVLFRDLLDRADTCADLFGEIQEHIHVSGYGPADPGKNLKKIQEIMRAIRTRKRIRLEYLRSYDGTLTQRETEPYGLISRFNNWYLVALCLSQQKRRIFLLDHIKYLEVIEASTFKWPEGFSVHDVYGSAWGVWTDGDKQPPKETVRLKVVKGLAERFRLVSYHDSQQVEMLPGGEALVTFTVTGAKEMIPWLMSWGGAVEVIEPPWLKEALVENLEQALQKYRSDNEE